LAIVAGDKGFCVGISLLLLFFFFERVRDNAWIIEYSNVTIEYCVGTKNLNLKVKLDVCLFDIAVIITRINFIQFFLG
jgi:hypothetical protein